LERQVEPLVMASEISGLAALRGYLKMGNLVVRLSFPFINLLKPHPAFMERRPPSSSPAEPAGRVARVTGTPAPGTTASDATGPPESPGRTLGHTHDRFFG
jgi:hypothetical protein